MTTPKIAPKISPKKTAPVGTALLLHVSALAFAIGCASTQMTETATPTDGTTPIVAEDYESRVEKYSAGDSQYSGFYNNFEYKATLLNAPIREVTINRQAEYYQWDATKKGGEKEKAAQEMNSVTKVFVSFFTPDRRNDNLTDSKSIWQVYLEAGGRRYQGKAIRIRTLIAELQALYPYHTRWATPYMLEFPVPTTAIETQDSKLTITGPLGTRAVDFKAIR